MNDPTTSSRPSRVLLVTASVGAGHLSAARAIATGLGQLSSGLHVETVDALALTPRWFRACYVGGFTLGMTRLPRIYGLGYILTDHPQRPGRARGERIRLWRERQVLKQFSRFVLDFAPDLIVHTHFLTTPTLGLMITRGKLSAGQFVVVTDNDPHRFWYAQNVAHWFLPAAISAERLTRWGVGESRITVSGMPIHPKWDRPTPREKVLADWRLPADKKIVILTGGTTFTCGPVVKLTRRILELCPNICLVVLAGQNKKLLGRLARAGSPAGRLVPISFTDRIHELVSVGSLMVTKAGGVTTAECLAAGVPMLLTSPVPGQEAGNARYLQANGAAIITQNYHRVPAEVKRLMNDEKALRQLAENARGLYRPGTATIVRAIAGSLRL